MLTELSLQASTSDLTRFQEPIQLPPPPLRWCRQHDHIEDFIDSQLSMDVHVAAVCRSGYYHLRQLRPLTRSLSSAAAETVVHAFIASRLDYCNALLYGVSDKLMRRLQSVQNAAARLVTVRCAVSTLLRS